MLTLLIVYAVLLLLWSLRRAPAAEPEPEPAADAVAERSPRPAAGVAERNVRVVRRHAAVGG